MVDELREDPGFDVSGGGFLMCRMATDRVHCATPCFDLLAIMSLLLYVELYQRFLNRFLD